MIPAMMLCVDIKSGYDFIDDMCTRKIRLIPMMMLCVHIKSGYDSRDDVMCTPKIML